MYVAPPRAGEHRDQKNVGGTSGGSSGLTTTTASTNNTDHCSLHKENGPLWLAARYGHVVLIEARVESASSYRVMSCRLAHAPPPSRGRRGRRDEHTAYRVPE